MRKLAAALDASPMSLYTYYPDREAVLEALTQLVLAEVDVPDEDLDWRGTIRQIMRAIRPVGVRHPPGGPLINPFPPRPPDALAFVEAGFRAFRRAGFDDVSTARCYRALAVYSMGTFDVELSGYFDQRPGDHAGAYSLAAPSMERHLPNLARIGPALAGQDVWA